MADILLWSETDCHELLAAAGQSEAYSRLFRNTVGECADKADGMGAEPSGDHRHAIPLNGTNGAVTRGAAG